MKRILIILLIFAGITTFAWSQQEINYVVPQLLVWVDSEIWNNPPNSNWPYVTRRISKGEIVYSSSGLSAYNTYYGRDFLVYIYNDNDDRRQLIPANNLRPLSDIYLPEDWITKGEPRKKWVMSYYLDVLRSQDRNTFMKYEEAWINHEIYLISSQEGYEGSYWYDSRWINPESLVITHPVIKIGGFEQSSFYITDISSINGGFRLTLANSHSHQDPEKENTLKLPKYSDRQFFDLLFIPDGDYMDVYIDSLDNKYTSFAKVDSATFLEIESLLRTGNFDISKVQWPRRADGSTDYPPLPPSPAVTQTTQQPADTANTVAADTATETQNGTEKSSMPLWVWFASGAVVIAGGVLVVLKRKK
jgi:hypothetical protein